MNIAPSFRKRLPISYIYEVPKDSLQSTNSKKVKYTFNVYHFIRNVAKDSCKLCGFVTLKVLLPLSLTPFVFCVEQIVKLKSSTRTE